MIYGLEGEVCRIWLL